jgi:peptidoglycan/xylan/chitin deacetylase (PgdA/CDA1 family)
MLGCRRLRKWMMHNRWARSKAIILLYHRVSEVIEDPQWLCVSSRHFAEHLEVLRQSYHPVGLRTLIEHLKGGSLPPRTVVLTFDDGYADNLLEAKPLLDQASVPATIFVVAGQVGENREFWWDDLSRILLNTPVLPEHLELIIAGKLYSLNLDANSRTNTHAGDRWHVLMPIDPSPRHTLYRNLAPLLRDLDYEAREHILATLYNWAGLDSLGRTGYRALNQDELRMLVGNGMIEVGSHTMTHPVLSQLTKDAQREEIRRSKRALEEILGREIDSFSYPYGGTGDYTVETVKLVVELGFECACSNFQGLVGEKTDPHQLPRYIVRDWDGDKFASQLDEWFHG